MTPTDLSDERLMAYADDALDAESAEVIAHALREDPAAAARVEMFRATAERLRAAAAADREVPAALSGRVRAMLAAPDMPAAGAVTSLAPRRGARSVPFWQVPLAAGIALAIGLGGGALWTARDGPARSTGLALAPAGDLRQALGALPSGDSQTLADGSTVTVIASYRTEADTLCREFERTAAGGDTLAAVACRDGDVWQTRLAVTAGSGGDGYAPAAAPAALDAWAAAAGAGAPLDPEAEAGALAGD